MGLNPDDWKNAPKTLINNVEKEKVAKVETEDKEEPTEKKNVNNGEGTPPSTPFADTSKKRQTMFFSVSMDPIAKNEDDMAPELPQSSSDKVILCCIMLDGYR